jgi:pilus assembly protein CpaF
MRPDRIIIGEIRGGEALDIIQAMVSGHGGCLGTLHATHPRDTLTRLETMAMMSDVQMPLVALRLQIASGVNFIAQVARYRDGTRKLTHLTEVLGFDMTTGRYQLQDIFVRQHSAKDGDGDGPLASALTPSGHLPSQMQQLAQYGTRLPEAVLTAAKNAGGSP